MRLSKWKDQKQVTFSGSNTSESIDVGDFDPAFIYLPAEFAGSAVTFEGKVGDAWVAMQSGGSAISHTVVTGKLERLPATIAGVSEIRLVSDATETVEGTILVTT